MTHQELIEMFRSQKTILNFVKYIEHLEKMGVIITEEDSELDIEE